MIELLERPEAKSDAVTGYDAELAAAHALVVSRLGTNPWRAIDAIEDDLAQLPQQEMPLNHVFTAGLYLRTIMMPAGTLLTSRIHLTEHPFIISSGVISVWSDETGWQTLRAFHAGVTKPGTRRMLFAHTDVLWSTAHTNPDDERDPDKIVERVTFCGGKFRELGRSKS